MWKRVLLVDDSEVSRLYFTELLKHHGLEVDAATTGQEALDLLARTPYDAVFTDLEMPEMHGAELIQRLRAGTDGHELPIIVITAHGGEEAKHTIRSLGADEVLTKGSDDARLAELITRLSALPSFDNTGD